MFPNLVELVDNDGLAIKGLKMCRLPKTVIKNNGVHTGQAGHFSYTIVSWLYLTRLTAYSP